MKLETLLEIYCKIQGVTVAEIKENKKFWKPANKRIIFCYIVYRKMQTIENKIYKGREIASLFNFGTSNLFNMMRNLSDIMSVDKNLNIQVLELHIKMLHEIKRCENLEIEYNI